MRVEVARKNMPVNLSVLSRDEIDEIEESAVLPVISRRVPGLFVNERGHTGFGRTGSTSAGNISIRGVGGSPNSQVLVLVDGHPQFMGIFGHPLPNNYVASDLERVEVIRGPASLIYGSNAMGGVLNLITRQQKEEGVSGSMRFAYGSYHTSKLMVNSGFKSGKFDFFVSYNHDETDGHREDMGFLIDNSYIKAGYRISDHYRLSADFNIADMKSSDPGREMDQAEPFIADMIRGKASFALDNSFKKIEGSLFAYYNFGDHDFSDGWKSRDENMGVSFYQGYKPFEGNLITFGLDYKVFGGRGNVAFPPTYANQWLTVEETGTYFIVKQNVLKDRLILNGGVRLESNSLFGSKWLPQMGAISHLTSSLSLKASYSEGFRSPTIMELYLFAPNAELQPEESRNLDFSVRKDFRGAGIHAELTFFMVEGENIIQSLPNPNPPPMFKRVNSGSFNHKGIELEAGYNPASDFSADFTYSFLNMDDPKLSAPEHQAFVALSYAPGPFRMSLQGNYIGGLYVLTEGMDDAFPQALTEDYFLLNASLKYQMNKELEFFISLKNLLDTDYQIDYGYTMPGINIMAGAGLKF